VNVLAIAAALTTAAVLLRAAVGKARRPGDLVATITRLGAPRVAAVSAAALLISAELATAAALLFRPDAGLTQLSVVTLAVVFAAAGLRAMRIGEPVACNCFGAGGGALGLRQVLLLIPWTAAAAILRLGARAPSAQTGAIFFAAIAVAIAELEGMALLRSMREARDDRRSAEEMYEWLPSY
jgi:hypothetical protein